MKQITTSTQPENESEDTRELEGSDNGGGAGEVGDDTRGIIRTLKSHDFPEVTPQIFNSRSPSTAAVSLSLKILARRKARLSR